MFGPVATERSRRRSSPDLMADVLGDFDRVVNEFVAPRHAITAGIRPSCEVIEMANHYLVSFDTPGMKREDIKIEVHGNELIVSGERQRHVRDDRERTLHRERAYGKFERTFTLPTSITPEKVEAHYDNGVLNIALPKAESARGRSVQIQTGETGFFNKLLGAKKDAKELKNVKVG